MKKTLLHIVCALSCVLFSAGVEAQVEPNTSCSGTVRIFNNSNDAWSVKYYGNVINVPAGTNANLGLVNADPSLSRIVYLTGDQTCAYSLPNSNSSWNPPCASGTYSVDYYATYYTPQGIPLPGVVVNGQACFANSAIVIQ
jgi:hypothetical protein